MIEFDIKDFRDGGRRSWAIVYNESRDALITIAILILKDAKTAEDMVQASMEKAFRNKDKFEDLDHIKKFLKTTIRNHCIDHLRYSKNKSLNTYDPEFLFSGLADLEEQESIAKELLWRRLFKQIEVELPNLSPRQREIFRLYWMEELTYSQIAEQLSITEQSVRNEHLDARKALRRRLREKGLFRPTFFIFLKIPFPFG